MPCTVAKHAGFCMGVRQAVEKAERAAAQADLVLPAGYAGDKVELLEQLEQFIKEQDTAYSCIIKVEQSYTAAHK